MDKLPAELGFFMPPEWSSHDRCWMAWPTDLDDYYKNIEGMRTAYAETAGAIARFEPVIMLANAIDKDDAQARCGDSVEVIEWRLDDSWTRDSGPTFVKDGRGKLAAVDWKFNAWGEIVANYDEDAAMARRIADYCDVPTFEVPIYLEGGAIHTDGEGTLLTTESVVLNDNRNPGLTRGEAERIFRDYLGIEKVIWLENVMEWDDTDGHVDNLACFARPGVVTIVSETNQNDSHFSAIEENLNRLKHSTDAKNRSLEIVRVPQPARRDWDGHRLPMTYINYYVANRAIVMPSFGDPMDDQAREILAQCFPDREIVSVPGVEIVKGGGCIHCITQQQPER